ncbi:hypothetical protein [Streptomyces sp. NPDC058326]|uniref:hypothetical protein n=1 Tax=Streptomyces sp. NPDC058326 TaxID=3346447 RepID=UPI0036EF5779
MSTSISSLPVLRGRGGAVLSVEDIGLVLDLPREQVTFTPDGLGRIRAEGRSVLIELRAKAGAAPRVHRVDDVDEAAATAFADGVDAILANRTDSDDIDGAPFAVVRSLTPTWRTRFHRRILRGALWHLLALVVLCLVAGSLSRWDLVLLTVPMGGFAWLGLCPALYGVIRARRERWLYRHGVMVTATRATMSRGAYIYPDATGTYRGFLHGEAGPTITVAHPPEDPADVLVPASPFTHLVNTYAGAVQVFCCNAMIILHIVITADSLLDSQPSTSSLGPAELRARGAIVVVAAVPAAASHQLLATVGMQTKGELLAPNHPEEAVDTAGAGHRTRAAHPQPATA